ncbi:MAG: hypothetical protein HY904_08455 [Deltaproteobacteria bacterium]|nr:hypothetical protein [Deltaproteobacteria bacterium]
MKAWKTLHSSVVLAFPALLACGAAADRERPLEDFSRGTLVYHLRGEGAAARVHVGINDLGDSPTLGCLRLRNAAANINGQPMEVIWPGGEMTFNEEFGADSSRCYPPEFAADMVGLDAAQPALVQVTDGSTTFEMRVPGGLAAAGLRAVNPTGQPGAALELELVPASDRLDSRETVHVWWSAEQGEPREQVVTRADGNRIFVRMTADAATGPGEISVWGDSHPLAALMAVETCAGFAQCDAVRVAARVGLVRLD